MSNSLRFLFSGNDVNKIALPIQIIDVPPQSSPAPDTPTSQAMKLSFRQNDPGPVQIRPLFPGTLRFIVDSSAPGVLPDPLDVDFTTATYDTWKTTGKILITIADKKVSNELSSIAPDLPVKPNAIWYDPVHLGEQFLFDTLVKKLPKGVISLPNKTKIRPANPNWGKYAIAQFLAGYYTPTLLHNDTDATKDSIATCIMPTVVVPVTGDIELFITTALLQAPQDGNPSELEDANDPVSPFDPAHPAFGLIPAREVYRQFRAKMVAEAASEPLRNVILATWPDAPRFFPISLTRTSELTPNCSFHFVKNVASLKSGAAILHEERIPSHGIIFLKQIPANPLPVDPTFEFSLKTGYMKWLTGGGTSWQEMGTTNPLAIDLSTIPKPHISLRLPMEMAMFADKNRPAPHGMSCTYLSMRRTVRALIDNRIAGGRLNYGVATTSATTRGIIQRAFTGTLANVNMVAANAPDPFGDPVLALTLEPILRAFFPNPAAQEVFADPAPANAVVYDQGQVAYRLWQSMIDNFESNQKKRNFSDNYIGRGGPGAAVYLGLATFHVDPVRNAGETDAAYSNRIVQEMKVGLNPGALLQFWHYSADYDSTPASDIKHRTIGGRAISYGHSPLFVKYSENAASIVDGLVILDQHVNAQGESFARESGNIGNQCLQWAQADQQIWIAANWKE